MHHYNHDDKLIISIPDSLSILQSLQNGNVGDICRVLFLSGGFVGDAFQPVLSKSTTIGASGECSIVMMTGDVVFANGEIFHGDGLPVTIAIPRSNETQYIIASYQLLRHIKMDTADGYGLTENVYGYRRDGVRLRVADALSASIGVNDLLIAEVRNPLDGSAPVLTDRRLAARHYRASSALDIRSDDASTCASAYHGIVPSEAGPDYYGNQYRSAMHNDDRPGVVITHAPTPSELTTFQYVVLSRATPSSIDRIATHWHPRAAYSFALGVPGETMRCRSQKQDRNDGSIMSTPLALDSLILGRDIIITTPPIPMLGASYDSATGHLLIDSSVDMGELFTEASQHRSYMQLWMRDGSISHDIDPDTMPLQIEMDVRDAVAESGYYPKRHYVPMGSSRSAVLSARTIVPGQIAGRMQTLKLTRSGTTWLECHFGPDFSYLDASYQWYMPLLGGDDWYLYNAYPVGGDSNHGRQTWWDDSLITTLRAPGEGWVIASAEFINHYVDDSDPQDVKIVITASNGTAELDFGYAFDVDIPYSSTTTDIAIALVEDEPISITLTSAAAIAYFANGHLRLGLTKEQGTA